MLRVCVVNGSSLFAQSCKIVRLLVLGVYLAVGFVLKMLQHPRFNVTAKIHVSPL